MIYRPREIILFLRSFIKKELIRRVKDENDGRYTKLVFTKDAEKIRKILRKEIERSEEILLKGISSEEQEIFKKITSKMLDNLEQEE